MMRRRDRVLLLLFCIAVVCIITAACIRKTTDVSDLGDDSIRLDESAARFGDNSTDLNENTANLDDDITGLYVEDKAIGTGNGLEITALGNDQYIVQLVQVDDFKVVERAELQSAYVRKKNEENAFYFYWYTGAINEPIENNDKFHDIIVYHVTIDHEKLVGNYHYISPNQLQGYEKNDIIFYKIEN